MKKRNPNRLAAEISLMLVIKCCLLWLAWNQWFAQPVAPHMRVADTQLQTHFFPSSQSHP